MGIQLRVQLAWLRAILQLQMHNDATSNTHPSAKMAIHDLLQDVVRKCPVSNTGFDCPLDDPRDYASGSSM